MRYRSARLGLLWVQCAAAATAMAVLGFRPPESGRMLLLPLWSADEGAAVRLALNGGALLIGAGPVRGSIVVQGRRANLADAAWNQRMVLMAAPAAGCGSTDPAGANA